MILTTDLHLTDKPDEAYRWEVFEHIKTAMNTHNDLVVGILGDMLDRRDRHSAQLINSVVQELCNLEADEIIILMGDHDRPVGHTEIPYWNFLNKVQGLCYVDEPAEINGALWLPCARDAAAEWAALDLDRYQYMFIHQKFQGAVLENGLSLPSGLPLALLPPDARVYSGDIHVAQNLRNVRYIGAPHPIKYGDKYPTALTVLNPDHSLKSTITLFPQQRIILDVPSPAKLLSMLAAPWIKPGASVKVRVKLSPENLTSWPATQAQIQQVAAKFKITVASVEGALHTTVESALPDKVLDLSPGAAIEAFAKHEKLEGGIVALAKKFAGVPEGAPAARPTAPAPTTTGRPRPRVGG